MKHQVYCELGLRKHHIHSLINSFVSRAKRKIEYPEESLAESATESPLESNLSEAVGAAATPLQQLPPTPASSRTSILSTHVEELMIQMEIEELISKIAVLEDKLQYASSRLTFEAIRENNRQVCHFTGLPTAMDFTALLHLCEKVKVNYYLGWKVESIKLEEQLLMTLMKLRLNPKHIDLAQRFGTSEQTVTNITVTWITVLHKSSPVVV